MSVAKSGPKPFKAPPALSAISSKPITASPTTNNNNQNNNINTTNNNFNSTANSTSSLLSLPNSLSSSSKPSLNRPQSFQHIPGITPTETVSAAIDLNQLKHGRSASHYFSYVESVNLLARGAKFILHEWDDDFNDYPDDNSSTSISKLSQSLTTELETPVKSRAIFLFYKSPFEIEKARKDSILDGNIKLSGETDLQFHESPGIFFWNYSKNNRTMVKSRSLPVSCITDVFMGKQAPIFSSPFLTHLNEHNCFSIIGSQALINGNNTEIDTEKIHEGFVELDLEASNTETATNWLLALNSMLSYSGTQVHYDDPDSDEIKDSNKKQLIIEKSTSDVLLNKVMEPSPNKQNNTTTSDKSNFSNNTNNNSNPLVIARSHTEFDSSEENSDNEDNGPKLQIVRQLVENTLAQTSANKNPPGSDNINNNNNNNNSNMVLQRPKQVSLFLKDSEPNSAAIIRDPPDNTKLATLNNTIPNPVATNTISNISINNNSNTTNGGTLSIPATIQSVNHVEDDEEEKRLKLELENIRTKNFNKSQSFDAKLTGKPTNFTPVKSNSNITPNNSNKKKTVLSGLKARITPLVSPKKEEEKQATTNNPPNNTDTTDNKTNTNNNSNNTPNDNSGVKPVKASVLSIRNKPKLTISAEKRRSLITAMKNTEKLEQILSAAPQSSADIKPEAVLEFVETPLPQFNKDKDTETEIIDRTSDKRGSLLSLKRPSTSQAGRLSLDPQQTISSNNKNNNNSNKSAGNSNISNNNPLDNNNAQKQLRYPPPVSLFTRTAPIDERSQNNNHNSNANGQQSISVTMNNQKRPSQSNPASKPEILSMLSSLNNNHNNKIMNQQSPPPQPINVTQSHSPTKSIKTPLIDYSTLNHAALLALVLSQNEQIQTLTTQLNHQTEQVQLKQQVNARVVARLLQLERKLRTLDIDTEEFGSGNYSDSIHDGPDNESHFERNTLNNSGKFNGRPRTADSSKPSHQNNSNNNNNNNSTSIMPEWNNKPSKLSQSFEAIAMTNANKHHFSRSKSRSPPRTAKLSSTPTSNNNLNNTNNKHTPVVATFHTTTSAVRAAFNQASAVNNSNQHAISGRQLWNNSQ